MTPLGAGERQALLDVAHAALKAHFHGPVEPVPPRVAHTRQPGGHGAFVTLRVRDRLRGCVGALGDGRPLVRAVAELAVVAATGDWRFRPVHRDELDALDVEISILSSPAPVSPEAVVPGRDGVIVEMDGRRALLLPQVATEHGFTREQLLDACCEKAGLPARAWEDPRCEVQAFTADVFADERRARAGTGDGPGMRGGERP